MKYFQIENLNLSYGEAPPVLEGISFQIEKGESVGLIGPMGSGKTTLLLAVAGLISFSGSVRMEGDVLSPESLRRKLGIVFQNPDDQLFMPTVYEDIAFGPMQMGLSEEEVQKRVQKALKQVGLEGFEHRPPHHLSGGEKKAISIATVLSMEPEMILLDEPTSNLDPYHRRKIIHLLREISSTFLIASHDLDFLWETTSRSILLSKKVIEGPTREILSNKEMLEEHHLELPLHLQKLKDGG